MGCNERKAKKELVRIVRTPDGEIKIDASGKMNGRGAYICPSLDCLKRVRKSGRLARVLETQIPDIVFDSLEEQIKLLNVLS